jgi:CheY-like chemotaxis protein
MVADDEPGILAVVERFAKGLGFDVVLRAGGRAVLAALEQAPPDVLLVDLKMG